MRTAMASSRPPWTRSAISRRLWRARRRAGPLLAAQARHEVHEAEHVLLLEGLSGHRHHVIQVGGRLGLETAQQLEEILEVLTSQARYLLLADEPGPVTGCAVVKVGELGPGHDFGRIDLGRALARPMCLVLGGQTR